MFHGFAPSLGEHELHALLGVSRGRLEQMFFPSLGARLAMVGQRGGGWAAKGESGEIHFVFRQDTLNALQSLMERGREGGRDREGVRVRGTGLSHLSPHSWHFDLLFDAIAHPDRLSPHGTRALSRDLWCPLWSQV
jgi:hypothetical protein